jgi:hypothetical protein
MLKRFIVLLVLSISLFFSPALTQTSDKKATFDGQAAFSYIEVLAADAMLGRKSGEPGGRMAAEYIVSRLKAWGLEPAGPQGTFYQDLTVEYTDIARDATLEILDWGKKREFVYGEDWRAQRYSGSGHLAAEIVFIGYGISAPGKGYDDYSGVDVKGKLVLFSSDSPRRLEDKLKDEAQIQSRVKAAQDHGACGLLMFQSQTQDTRGFGFRARLEKEVYKPDFVIISVENKVVDLIFKHLKTELRYLFQQIEMTSQSQSFATGVRSFVNLDVTFDEKRPTQNVLAKISGTDKTLKNEYVILGAHMDHLGIDMTGDVFNGADDNASGTAVVMEVARVMKLNRTKPRRTVIFALWAAEEMGLLGSKYYTENPVYPLEKTVAYINLDMEGHGSGKVNFRGAYYGPEIWDLLAARLPKELLDITIPGRGGPGGSDHTYFLSSGVPAFFVATDGFHYRTNRVGDVIELIRPEILKKAGDVVGAAIEVLAMEPKVPILPERRETYYWRYQTLVNHEIPPLEKVTAGHKDVLDPDVDFQLTILPEKEGANGDPLRLEMMNSLLTGQADVRASKGLVLYDSSGQAMTGRRMSFGRGPAKTTVLVGLKGLASLRDNLSWADVFSKQGVAFVHLEQPDFLFDAKGLNEEGKKIVDALSQAGLFLIVRGTDSEQSKALLENAGKPVLLVVEGLPEKDILDLIKKTGSALGFIFGKDEDAGTYFRKLDEAKKALGTENLSIVNENCLWGNEAKRQMIDLIGEMLRAKYENEEMANLFSGTFQRTLAKARSAAAAGPTGFMPF